MSRFVRMYVCLYACKANNRCIRIQVAFWEVTFTSRHTHIVARMCDGIRKRPSAVLSPIHVALQSGARLQRSCYNGATSSHRNDFTIAPICIDLESNSVAVKPAGSSSDCNIERSDDGRFHTARSEDGQIQAETVTDKKVDTWSPTQAWPPVPLHYKRQIINECSQQRSPQRVRLTSKRPCAVVPPTHVAEESGARLRKSSCNGATDSLRNTFDIAPICIDLESNMVANKPRGRSSACNIEENDDGRFHTARSEDVRLHAEPMTDKDVETCSQTQAWLPVPFDLKRQMINECSQQSSPKRVRLVSSKQLWSPHRLRPYCEKLAESRDTRVRSVGSKHIWSPHRLGPYCKKLPESRDA